MKTLPVLLKTLSDESRLRILNLLVNGGEICVCDIERILGFTQSKVSRHLTSLKHCGLVTDRRSGTWIFYSLNNSSLEIYLPFLKELTKLFVHSPLLQNDLSRLNDTNKYGACAKPSRKKTQSNRKRKSKQSSTTH